MLRWAWPVGWWNRGRLGGGSGAQRSAQSEFLIWFELQLETKKGINDKNTLAGALAGAVFNPILLPKATLAVAAVAPSDNARFWLKARMDLRHIAHFHVIGSEGPGPLPKNLARAAQEKK